MSSIDHLKAHMDLMSAAEPERDIECVLSVAPKADREALRTYARSRPRRPTRRCGTYRKVK